MIPKAYITGHARLAPAGKLYIWKVLWASRRLEIVTQGVIVLY